MNKVLRVRWSALLIAGAVTLVSCANGPDEAAFVAACLVEGAADETACECGAREAKKMMSADAYSAMIYEMGGKRQEAADITRRMSEADQIKMIEQTSKVFDNCFLDEQN